AQEGKYELVTMFKLKFGRMVGKTKSISKISPESMDSATKGKKNPGRQKSPGRPKSPKRQKSPARQKSPGRKSPARTASPPRSKPAETTTKARPGTPTRTSTRTRSPARQRNASPTISVSRLTPSRRSPIRRSPGRTVKEVSVEKEKAVRGRTRQIDVEIEPEDKVELKHLDSDEINSLGLIRRFTRSSQSQNREVERVVHLKHFDSVTVTKRLGEFSDEDERSVKTSQSDLKEFADTKSLTEFGGVYGAFLMIMAVPLSVVSLHVFCNESHCSFTKLPNLKKYKLLSTYFDAKSILGVFAYITLLAVLSAIPFGGRKIRGLPNRHKKFDYVMNGLLSFVILLSTGVGLELRNIHIANYILNHIFHLLIASILFGALLSIYVYVKSYYVPVSALNPYTVGKHGVYAFFMGREINPRIFSIVDLKILAFRVLCIGAVLLDFAYLYHSLEIPSNKTESIEPKLISLQPTLVVFILLHSIYFLDGLIFEHSFVSTFEVQQEAFGYMLAMGYLTYPFLTILVAKYITEHGVELDTWKLLLTSLVFIIGYILYRGSNSQKDAFRKNPYSPSLAHLETIPTTQGKKLMVSGFWGIIRHPNYLGDILMHLSFVPFVVCVPPVIYPYLTVLILIHRAHRDHARCKQKYGAAWDRYCNRVKYVLIPKVY
ncbi:hypothetical protein NQ317_018353, partial [Molorchus minor]